jgi:hypothetical protein
MKKLLTFLVATFMTVFTVNAQNVVQTVAPTPSAYCKNTQITVKFYATGNPVFNAAYGSGFSYKVYINSTAPFSAGIALNPVYNPDSLSGATHYLKKFSSSSPGVITVTIPSGFVGTPYIGVTLINGTSGSPAGIAYGKQITVYSASISTPTITVTGGQSVCSGNSVTLTASSAYLYSWAPSGQTTSSIVVSPTATTTYSLTVSNPCSNSASSTKTITVFAVPTASISPSANQTFCQGTTMTLTASGGANYSWSTGAVSSSIAVNSSGNYYAVVSNGCPSQDVSTSTVTVVVNAKPTVVVAPTPASVCFGSSHTITASGGISYLWNTGGQTTSSIIIVPTVSANYSVTVTDVNGCSNLSFGFVNVLPLPVANAGTDKTILSGNSTTIGGASSGASYSWSNGATTQTIIVNPTVTSTYTLIVSGQCGSDTDSVTVVVTANPTAVTDVYEDAINISVYPNPTSNELFIGGFYNKEVTISVYDIVGNKIMSDKSEAAIVKINVAELSSGTYILTVTCDGKNYNRRFVKTE